jgi:HNH endonuclease
VTLLRDINPTHLIKLEELAETAVGARFAASTVVSQSGCWLWTAHCSRDGYGRLWDGERRVSPHRWIYSELVGPIPPGLEMDHLCRTRNCVNPEHLEPVTHRENILRGVSPPALHARKTHCPQGHEYTAENTLVSSPRGVRVCRTCKRASDRRYKARLRTGREQGVAA